MEIIKSELTPENIEALASFGSYFGIRPGTLYTGTLEVFDGLPEALRPQVTIEYMTSSARAEYADRMAALMPKGQAPDGEEAVMDALRDKRTEHQAINEWLIKKHLVSIEKYPDATSPGQFIAINREGNELSAASWETLSFALRPHVAAFIIAKNFASELEKNAVKS